MGVEIIVGVLSVKIPLLNYSTGFVRIEKVDSGYLIKISLKEKKVSAELIIDYDTAHAMRNWKSGHTERIDQSKFQGQLAKRKKEKEGTFFVFLHDYFGPATISHLDFWYALKKLNRAPWKL